MAKDFDASYQIRAGLREREIPEGDGTPTPPTLDAIAETIRVALEAELVGYEVSVTAERLDV